MERKAPEIERNELVMKQLEWKTNLGIGDSVENLLASHKSSSLCFELDLHGLVIIFFLLWVIWLERNARVYEKKFDDITSLLDTIRLVVFVLGISCSLQTLKGFRYFLICSWKLA